MHGWLVTGAIGIADLGAISNAGARHTPGGRLSVPAYGETQPPTRPASHVCPCERVPK
jgi:hypothetical protein